MTRKKIAPKRVLTVETEEPGETKYRAKILRITRETVWETLYDIDSPEEAMQKAEGIISIGGPETVEWYEEDVSYEIDLIEETTETVREWMK